MVGPDKGESVCLTETNQEIATKKMERFLIFQFSFRFKSDPLTLMMHGRPGQ